MTGLIILLGIISAYAVAVRAMGLTFEVPPPFACGEDGICNCEMSKNCKKKQ